jgi:hypothetical protein
MVLDFDFVFVLVLVFVFVQSARSIRSRPDPKAPHGRAA